MRSTSAPYSRTASTLIFGATVGMTTVQRFPKSEQAYAIAWPKLPEEAVMMCACLTFDATLYAARNLKLPVYWSVSLASTRSTPSFFEMRGASAMVVGRGGGGVKTGDGVAVAEST